MEGYTTISNTISIGHQDWDTLLSNSRLQGLANWVHQNVLSYNAESGLQTTYDFLTEKFLPQVEGALSIKGLDDQTLNFLKSVERAILAPFGSQEFLKVSSTIRDHCVIRSIADAPAPAPVSEQWYNGNTIFPDSTTGHEIYWAQTISSNSGIFVEEQTMYSPPAVPIQQVNSPDRYFTDRIPGISPPSFQEPMDMLTDAQQKELFGFTLLTNFSANPTNLTPVQPQPVAVNTYPIPIHITLLEETKAAVQNFKEQVAEWQLTEEKKEQYIEFSQAPQNSEEALKQLEEWKLSAELKELYRKYYPFLKNPEPVFKSFEELSEDIMKRIARLPKEPQGQRQAILDDFLRTLLIITTQPPRVVNYKTDFSSKLRLLLPKHHIAQFGIKEIVLWDQERTNVLPESTLAGNTKKRGKEWITILDNEIEFSLFIPENPRNVTRKRPRCDKSSSINADFFWIHYELQLKMSGFDENFTVITNSFPMQVQVHGSQNLKCWEAVIWSNAAKQFGISRASERPKAQSFRDIYSAINVRFRETTGRQLTDWDFKAVARKLIGTNFDKPETMVNFSDEFFTAFWDWFYQQEKFITHYLLTEDGKSNIWKEGKVFGYLDQEAITNILRKHIDRFLLRLSVSTPNAFSLHFVDSKHGVVNFKFTEKDLSEKLNLVNTINAGLEWNWLYCPMSERLPKSEIFLASKQQSRTSNQEGGFGIGTAVSSSNLRYVQPRVVFVLEEQLEK